MTIPELAPNHYGHIHSAKVVEVVSPTEMVVDEIQLIDADKLNAEIKSVEQRGQRLIAAQNERERIERQRERERSRSSSSSDRDRYDSSDNDLSASDVRKAIEARYSQRIEVVKRQAKYSRVQLRLIGYPTVGATLGARWSGYDPRGPQIAVVDDSASKGDKKGRSRNVELVAVNAEMLRKGLTEQQFDELLAARGMTRRDFVNMVREKLQANTGSVRDTQPFILAALEQARADYQKQQAESASGGEGDADAGSDSARRSDFLKQKYGDKKVDGEKPDAESKAKDKKSFFEQKYGDKSKTKDADAEAKE
jgi:hypothetical protein